MTAQHEEWTARFLAELSYFLLKQGMLIESRICLDGLSEFRPQHATTHLLNGMFAFAIQKYQEAERYYRRILENDPNDATALVYLAESLIAGQRWREADEILTRVSKASPSEHVARFASELRNGLQQGIFQRGTVG